MYDDYEIKILTRNNFFFPGKTYSVHQWRRHGQFLVGDVSLGLLKLSLSRYLRCHLLCHIQSGCLQ